MRKSNTEKYEIKYFVNYVKKLNFLFVISITNYNSEYCFMVLF